MLSGNTKGFPLGGKLSPQVTDEGINSAALIARKRKTAGKRRRFFVAAERAGKYGKTHHVRGFFRYSPGGKRNFFLKSLEKYSGSSYPERYAISETVSDVPRKR